jgi:acyl-CoA thioester hydrolase
VLDIGTRVADLGRRSLRFEFELTSQTDDRLVATGHIVTVMVARETWEPCPIPDRLREAIEIYESGPTPVA